MTKMKNLYYRFALLFSAFLGAVLFVAANSNSCLMVHQPEAPESLRRYSKIK